MVHLIDITSKLTLTEYAKMQLGNTAYYPLCKQVSQKVTTPEQAYKVKACIEYIAIAVSPSSSCDAEEKLWGAMGSLMDFIDTSLEVEGLVAKLLSELGHKSIVPNDKNEIFKVWPDFPGERQH